jgi:hypothetical protein
MLWSVPVVCIGQAVSGRMVLLSCIVIRIIGGTVTRNATASANPDTTWPIAVSPIRLRLGEATQVARDGVSRDIAAFVFMAKA